jgi:hypothetical protein
MKKKCPKIGQVKQQSRIIDGCFFEDKVNKLSEQMDKYLEDEK